MEYAERILVSNDWATYLLVGCFLLLATTKYFYPKRFDDFIRLPLTDRYLSIRGGDGVLHPFNVMLFIVQVVCVSVFIFMLARAFNIIAVENNRLLFVQILTGYSVFVLVKFLVEKIIAVIFSMEPIIDQYLYHKLSYRNFLVLFLFLGNVFFLYLFPNHGKPMLLFGVLILGLNAIVLYNSYQKNRKMITSNFFHFILYLCALEISPYIILYKVIVMGDGI